MHVIESLREASIEQEFANADLGDRRRTERLKRAAQRAEASPDQGFPRMMASEAELEGIYRLLSNEDVSAADVLAPHIAATFARAESAGECIVIHDTSEFEFGGTIRREGLGLLGGNGHQQGFLVHLALAVMPGEARLPLGVCGLRHIRRLERTGASKHGIDRQGFDDRESLRWEDQIEEIEQARGDRFSCIHVTDREADIYDVLALLVEKDARFVIRAHHDRAVADEDTTVLRFVQRLVPIGTKQIEIGSRHDNGRPLAQRRKHPARAGRVAHIAVASIPLTLKRPLKAHAAQAEIPVNLVRVWEPTPKAGEPPIEWILYTTERVDTAEQIFRVVDIYRARWVVEEFFKALKTGCSFEKRQLESFHALANALALFVPIAWKLLLARSFCRDHPTAPATSLLTDVQMQILEYELALKTPIATAEQATYAVARFGGHLKRNGLPGWLTLGRGFEALLLAQIGWRAAMAAQKCDQ